MTIKLQLESSLIDAMRAQDDLRKRTVRMALSSLRLMEIEKGRELDDQAVTSILQKEVKTRQEAIEEAQRAGRPDLEQAARAEIAVLEGFLPSQMSTEELEGLASQVISELGATSQRDMGQVMKALMPRLEGRASGEQASQVVRKLLA
jgi:hypothetical protein